jgi:hypothetical protein
MCLALEFQHVPLMAILIVVSAGHPISLFEITPGEIE